MDQGHNEGFVMCKHCELLTEDKEIVHSFMAAAARRLSAMHKTTITADDIEISLTIEDPSSPRVPLLPEPARTRAMQILHDLGKPGEGGFVGW